MPAYEAPETFYNRFNAVDMCPASQAQTTELSVFLGKLKTYASTHQVKYKWMMPVIKPADSQAQMPSPAIIGYIEDTGTGLRYFPESGRVYDAETGFTFNILNGKIYKEELEIKLEKYQSI